MNKRLACRHHLKKMVEIQRKLTPLKILEAETIYQHIDHFSPFIFVDYTQMRLIPLIILTNTGATHKDYTSLNHPFFNLWADNIIHQLYFGSLPESVFDKIQKEPSHHDYLWFDKIRNSRIIIRTLTQIKQKTIRKKPGRKKNTLRDTLHPKNVTKSHKLPKFNAFFSDLLFDIQEQLEKRQSIGDLAPKYNRTYISLDLLCLENPLFQINFLYTITRLCDFTIVLVIRKGYLEDFLVHFDKNHRLYQEIQHKQTKILEQYLSNLQKMAEVIHYYDCDSSDVLEIFGVEAQLENLFQFIYKSIQIENILFISISTPPQKNPAILPFEIRNYYQKKDGKPRWDLDRISKELSLQFENRYVFKNQADYQTLTKLPQKNYGQTRLKPHFYKKTMFSPFITSQQMLPENKNETHLTIFSGLYQKDLQNEPVDFMIFGDLNHAEWIAIGSTGLKLQNPQKYNIPEIVSNIQYRFSKKPCVIHNQYYRSDLIREYGRLRCVGFFNQEFYLESLFQLGDTFHFDTIIIESVNNRLVLILCKKDIMKIYTKLNEIYPKCFHIAFELK